MKNIRIRQVILVELPFIAFAAGLWVKFHFDSITRLFLPCPFLSITHRLCPACGNTRSVGALLRLDVLTALRWNITPMVLLLLLFLLYVEQLFAAFGKKKLFLPRNSIFWYVVLFGMSGYYVLRNFM